MIATPIHTDRIDPGKYTLIDILDKYLQNIPPKSILAITSKIVSLCEGSVVPINDRDKDELIRTQADYFMSATESKYGINFTITRDTLIPNSGIDESNAGDYYILWPKNPQKTANNIRQYLIDRFGVKDIGVVITDSTCRPLRRGVSGIAIAFSGFTALHDYVGTPDLFGRPFKVAQSDIAGGLASTAVLIMGEGKESTPLALLKELDFVNFVPHNPTKEELQSLRISLKEDLFAPFLENVNWLSEKKRKKQP